MFYILCYVPRKGQRKQAAGEFDCAIASYLLICEKQIFILSCLSAVESSSELPATVPALARSIFES
jgi:hypothetical protein